LSLREAFKIVHRKAEHRLDQHVDNDILSQNFAERMNNIILMCLLNLRVRSSENTFPPSAGRTVYNWKMLQELEEFFLENTEKIEEYFHENIGKMTFFTGE